MYCKNCGNEVADGAKFCKSCGAIQETATQSAPKQTQAKANLTTKKKLPIGVILAIIFSLISSVLIISGIIGAVTYYVYDINPITYLSNTFTNSDEKLVNKWQSQDAPGIAAYEFHDDGTYDSYTLTLKFHGEYETKGDKIILRRANSSFLIEYKYSIRNDVLTMTLYKEGNDMVEIEKQKESKYIKVDELHQKSFDEL